MDQEESSRIAKLRAKVSQMDYGKVKAEDAILPVTYPEQRYWKFWTSPTDQRGLNVRVMSRLNGDGTFTMVIVWEIGGVKQSARKEGIKDDAEVIRLAEEYMKKCREDFGTVFTLRDFSDCDTFEKFAQKFKDEGLMILHESKHR